MAVYHLDEPTKEQIKQEYDNFVQQTAKEGIEETLKNYIQNFINHETKILNLCEKIAVGFKASIRMINSQLIELDKNQYISAYENLIEMGAIIRGENLKDYNYQVALINQITGEIKEITFSRSQMEKYLRANQNGIEITTSLYTQYMKLNKQINTMKDISEVLGEMRQILYNWCNKNNYNPNEGYIYEAYKMFGDNWKNTKENRHLLYYNYFSANQGNVSWIKRFGDFGNSQLKALSLKKDENEKDNVIVASITSAESLQKAFTNLWNLFNQLKTNSLKKGSESYYKSIGEMVRKNFSQYSSKESEKILNKIAKELSFTYSEKINSKIKIT